MGRVYLIITNERNNLSKAIDVTDYNLVDFERTAKCYADNFDVRVKRTLNA